MSGFLGGLDLGTPADRNHQALTADLELRRSAWKPPGGTNPGAYVYRGTGDLLLQHGRFYAGRQIPDRYADLMGEEGGCFKSALRAAEARPELRYCEGCYWTGAGYAMAHAWCVDADGLVEVTLPSTPDMIARMVVRGTEMPFMKVEHWAYWGVTFTTELADAHMRTIGQPMLPRSPAEAHSPDALQLDLSEPHDFPILQLPYHPDRKDWPWPLESHVLTPSP